jgi:serine/threonine protein kinase
VIHLKDTKKPLAFGRDDNDHTNKPDWLWAFGGQLLVISTPFLQGKHYATSPLQLLALVVQLEELHRNGYVHGDIRGLNVIFREGVKDKFTATVCHDGKDIKVDFQGFRGDLIDFDLAGMKGADTTRYPRGYQSRLSDGDRKGASGDTIVEPHEWRGLHYILFDLHRIDAPVGKWTLNNFNIALLRDNFREYFSLSSAPDHHEIQDLKSFLYKIHREDWSIAPNRKYREMLEDYGLYGQ